MRASGLRSVVAIVAGNLALWASGAPAQLDPEWISYLSADSSLSAGLRALVVDAAGVTYVTGVHGSSSNTDVITAAFRQDGQLLWSASYDGLAQWHDQGSGVALAPGGVVLVCGSTPDSNFYANVLVLAYDAGTGELLDSLQFSSGPYESEAAFSIAADSQGSVYVGGSTVGDGGDGLLLKLDAKLDLLWSAEWDGPAFAPYSQDSVLQLRLSPAEEPVALIHGVMASNHPDYVVVKYAPADGSVTWEATWGSNGEDAPRDMVIDPGGDVLVTGTALNNGSSQFGTIRLGGSDGALLWQEFDSGSPRDAAVVLTLDGAGAVYVTGNVDPDGDRSNFNDNFFTVKRDAVSGAFGWSHSYGSNGVREFDAPSDVIVDREGHVFVAGVTSSPPYSGDTITLVLDSVTGLETARGIVTGSSTQIATPRVAALDAADRLLVGGHAYDGNTGAVDISLFRYASQVGQDGHFVDLGYGLAGTYSPRLDGSGSLDPSGSFTISLTQLPPGTTGPLIVGLGLWYLPFKRGVLLPTADVLLMLPTGGGSYTIDDSMPPGLPSDLSIFLQAWFPDAGAPKGMSATNGLELITP
jgi:hypothetical protein